MSGDTRTARNAAILLGIGLGGFADGILLHQILQWHNMLSSRLPPLDMEAMRVNMTADGVFHLATWLATIAGVYGLARGTRDVALPRGGWLTGWLLVGWGAFNLVEGVIDHQLLGLHHVRYAPPHDYASPSLAWDLSFLAIGGVAMIALGAWLARSARDARDQRRRASFAALPRSSTSARISVSRASGSGARSTAAGW